MDEKKGLEGITKAEVVLGDVADEKILVRHDPQKLRKQLLLLLS
jgi:hypothetical protein